MEEFEEISEEFLDALISTEVQKMEEEIKDKIWEKERLRIKYAIAQGDYI